MKKYTVKGKNFVDSSLNKVTLKGINMVCKEKDRGYIGDYREEHFKFLASLGFNIIRFGIFWSVVEPEPGVYNDVYLRQIKAFSEMAAKYNLAVYLDMHQDLYSESFCEGAPLWATLTNGYEYEKTELWSEAYLSSPAVQAAFDNFWMNTKASDGIGLQDHYAEMWKHIATFFKDDENIIGLDILNEPFPGTSSGLLIQWLFAGIGMMLSTDHEATEEEIMETWMDSEKKAALFASLKDKEEYKNLVRPLAEGTKEFDETVLTAFYQKMRDAVRSVDKEVLLFIEANYFCNTGVPSQVNPPVDENGNQDEFLVYSPHGYDLMVDTDMYFTDCFSRLDVIFETHKEYADKNNLPTLVGEWGCYPNANNAQLKEAEYLLKKFEGLDFSNTYYDFSTFLGNPIIEVLKSN